MALTVAQTGARARAVLAEVERAVVGKSDAVQMVLLGVLAGGHVLIEDMPGLGKTLLARSFARALGLTFTRIQFTPDLLPQDLTGSVVYDQRTGEFGFREGPLFSQFVLADEINRTPPKTQAALLEAMAEHQVSLDRVTHPLPEPFVVLATQNPIEYEGTYALPEAQLDRFLLRVRLGYLPPEDESDMVRRRLDRATEAVDLAEVTTAGELVAMVRSLEQVEVHDDVLDYVVDVVQATRESAKVLVGASPRGTLAVVQLARARAVLAGRDFVTPEDVQHVAIAALGHRLVLRPELWVRQITGEEIVGDLLEQVPTPATAPAASSSATAATAATAAAAPVAPVARG